MNITDNLIRIKEGKDNIIKSLKNKGVSINDNTLINEIPTIIDNAEIGGGGGDTPSQPDVPELVQKYEGATCFRINVPTDNYEFTINLCNDSTKATYDVDWGDGVLESGLTTDEQHHTYRESGIYDINVYNLTSDIMLGERFSDTEYSSLFLNTNDLYWENDYVIKDFPDICTNIIIGSNITIINNYTFARLNELKSIIINDGVQYIYDYALSYTPNLKTLVLPQTLTDLDMQEYIGIEELILPNSVTELNSIIECAYLKRVQFSDNLNTMMGTLNNSPSLEEVDMSNTQLTSLPSDCFSSCKKLKKAILPNTITELPWQMFAHCRGLNYFVVPNGITRIEYGCFFYCDNLLQVELPSTLTYINNNVFYQCNNLQYIISHALVAPQIESQTFISENEDKHKYLYIHQNADIESYTTGYWGELLTKGWEIKYIEDIPTETTETTLKIKTKNNFPIVIDRIYFADLINRQLVDDEYVFTFDNSIDRLPKNIYPKNELIGITLPNTLQYILDDQVRECYNLEYVDIPNGVISIGNFAFYKCELLTEITIPSAVTNIGKFAFAFCYNLNKIVCKCMQAPILHTDNGSLKPFEAIPYEGTLYIYEGAKGFDDVDSEWYKELVQRRRWTIEYMEIDTLNYTSYSGDIVTPYAKSFEGKNEIVSNVYENGKGVITFKEGLTEIYDNMYNNDVVSGLTTIEIPNSVTKIGDYSFRSQYLTTLNVPDSVTYIGDSAFNGCTNLTEITLGSGVETIGQWAFTNCDKVSTITSMAMVAPTLNQSFLNVGANVSGDKILRVPQDAEGYDIWLSQLSDFTVEYI